jgi:hypothetical protein
VEKEKIMKKLYSTIGLEDEECEAENIRITKYLDSLPEGTYEIRINDSDDVTVMDDIHRDIWDVFEWLAIKEGVTIYQSGEDTVIESQYGSYYDTAIVHRYNDTELEAWKERYAQEADELEW